jgi:hypothetical protein
MDHHPVVTKNAPKLQERTRQIGKMLEQMRRENEIERCRAKRGFFGVGIHVARVLPTRISELSQPDFGAHHEPRIARQERALKSVAGTDLEATIEAGNRDSFEEDLQHSLPQLPANLCALCSNLHYARDSGCPQAAYPMCGPPVGQSRRTLGPFHAPGALVIPGSRSFCDAFDPGVLRHAGLSSIFPPYVLEGLPHGKNSKACA